MWWNGPVFSSSAGSAPTSRWYQATLVARSLTVSATWVMAPSVSGAVSCTDRLSIWVFVMVRSSFSVAALLPRHLRTTLVAGPLRGIGHPPHLGAGGSP